LKYIFYAPRRPHMFHSIFCFYIGLYYMALQLIAMVLTLLTNIAIFVSKHGYC
jgi:hypothetical protein